MTAVAVPDSAELWLLPEQAPAEVDERPALWRRVSTSAFPWLVVIGAGQFLQTRRSGYNKTAFEDEALYIYMGHRMIAHLLHGSFVREYPGSFFSGAPGFYPIFAAIGDAIGGLQGARYVSLIFAIAAMVGVYGIGRQLFGRPAGIIGAAAFSLAGSVVFLGDFATYDSCMMAFVSLAAWLAVWSAKKDALLWAPVVGMLLTCAFFAKYAGAVYIPAVAGLAAAVGWPRFGRAALRQAVVVVVSASTLIFAILCIFGRSLMDGIRSTTITRTTLSYGSTDRMVGEVKSWIGVWLLLALAGAFIIRSRRDALVSVALAAASLVGIVEQIRIHELTSFSKHVGFGLIFASPLIGKLFGALTERRYWPAKVVGIIAMLAMFGFVLLPSGVQNSHRFLTSWSEDAQLVRVLEHYDGRYPNKHILGESPAPEKYALRGVIRPPLWNDTYQLFYKKRVGAPAYKLAVEQDHYGLIYLTDGTKYGKLVQSLINDDKTDYRYITQVPRYLRGVKIGNWLVYGLRRATDGN